MNFWQKYKGIIITIVVVIAVIFLIAQISKWIKNRKRKNTFKNDYNNLIASGQKPTFPETAYIQMADKIYSCGGGNASWWDVSAYGTDEDCIVETFDQMNNELDVFLLVRAFGNRDGLDLGGYMSSEMSGYWIKEINTKLASKGIKYSF